MVAYIDNERQEKIDLTPAQAQRFWLVDRESKEVYKLRLAGQLYKDLLGLAEPVVKAEEQTEKEEAVKVVEEAAKEEESEERHQEETRTRTFRR